MVGSYYLYASLVTAIGFAMCVFLRLWAVIVLVGWVVAALIVVWVVLFDCF